MEKILIILILGLATTMSVVSYSESRSVKSTRIDSDGRVIYDVRGGNNPTTDKLSVAAYEKGEVVIYQSEVSGGATLAITGTAGIAGSIVGDTTWVRPYAVTKIDGSQQWFVEFNISMALASDQTAEAAFTIPGVTWKQSSNSRFTACSCTQRRSGGGNRECNAYIQHDDTDQIRTDTVAASAVNRWAVSCSVPLASKPTWVP